MEEKRSIDLRFDVEKDAFATIDNPTVSKEKNFDDMVGTLTVFDAEAENGVYFRFPIENFKVSDKKCLRNFKGFVRKIANTGKNLIMELSEGLDNVVPSMSENATLCCIGCTETQGIIGITLE